jgi:hypothetical protein
MRDNLEYAFGTFKGSADMLHIMAYSGYHAFQPVCTTKKRSQIVWKVRASVKEVNCPRCMKTALYQKLLDEHIDKTRPTYLEQRLAELGAKQVSLLPENAPERKPFPRLGLVVSADKEIRCAFYTVVVRVASIKAKYKGGLPVFVKKHRARCNRQLAVLCSMSSDDLDEPILDLGATSGINLATTA